MHQIKKPWSIHPGLTLEFLDWIPPQIFASQPCHPSTTTATIRAMLRLATSAALLGLGVAIPWADSTCQAAPGCEALQLEGAGAVGSCEMGDLCNM
jgi:hypothetical protein